MKIGDMRIIDESQESSMVSSWTEYLCLERISESKFELSIKGFSVIGELSDYYDEETEDYIIPDEINGQNVIGREDEYIVGEPLVNHSDDVLPIEFQNIEDEAVLEWFESAGRDYTAVVQKIKTVMAEN